LSKDTLFCFKVCGEMEITVMASLLAKRDM
jgi:hypothetical protein